GDFVKLSGGNDHRVGCWWLVELRPEEGRHLKSKIRNRKTKIGSFGGRRRGQHDADRGAARIRIDVDPAVVVENGSLHDGQTETHAACLGRAKRREDFLPQVGRDSATIVLNGDDHATGPAAFANRFGGQGNARFVLTGCGFRG